MRCYTCTQQFAVQGVVLSGIDFLAGAKSKVDAMVATARPYAGLKAKKAFGKVKAWPPSRDGEPCTLRYCLENSVVYLRCDDCGRTSVAPV